MPRKNKKKKNSNNNNNNNNLKKNISTILVDDVLKKKKIKLSTVDHFLSTAYVPDRTNRRFTPRNGAGLVASPNLRVANAI